MDLRPQKYSQFCDITKSIKNLEKLMPRAKRGEKKDHEIRKEDPIKRNFSKFIQFQASTTRKGFLPYSLPRQTFPPTPSFFNY